jgi:hypothetical protein
MARVTDVDVGKGVTDVDVGIKEVVDSPGEAAPRDGRVPRSEQAHSATAMTTTNETTRHARRTGAIITAR